MLTSNVSEMVEGKILPLFEKAGLVTGGCAVPLVATEKTTAGRPRFNLCHLYVVQKRKKKQKTKTQHLVYFEDVAK